MSKPKQPAAPNYENVARIQGEENLKAIRAGANLNRVNQINPYGSTTYQNLGGDQWEQTTSLSPDQQAILDAQEGNQIDLGRIAGQRLGEVEGQGTLDLSGLPSQVTSTPTSRFRTDITSPATRYSDLNVEGLPGFGAADVQRNLDYSGAPSRADAQYQRSVDLSGLSAMPGVNDFGDERQRVENALYGRATANLDPQFQQREEALRTRLINSGNVEGSEAWKREMGNLERERQSAYSDARDRSILAGGGEQSRLFSDALSGRNQQLAEILRSGEFTNAAAEAANQYGLASRGQGLGEAQTAGQFTNTAAGQINAEAASQRAQRLSELERQASFGNQAAQQELQAELTRTGLYNAAEGDQFQQAQANAALANQGRATGLSELLTQRNLPLQEFMALYGGAPAPGMSSPAVPQAGTPQAGDFQGAANAQYGAQADQYNLNQQRNAQNTNAMVNLAAIAAAYYSDRRLKTDIRRTGTLPNGIPTYAYRYLNESIEREGVLSDEVREVAPEAVSMGVNGFDRVNYAVIGATHLVMP